MLYQLSHLVFVVRKDKQHVILNPMKWCGLYYTVDRTNQKCSDQTEKNPVTSQTET